MTWLKLPYYLRDNFLDSLLYICLAWVISLLSLIFSKESFAFLSLLLLLTEVPIFTNCCICWSILVYWVFDGGNKLWRLFPPFWINFFIFVFSSSSNCYELVRCLPCWWWWWAFGDSSSCKLCILIGEDGSRLLMSIWLSLLNDNFWGVC